MNNRPISEAELHAYVDGHLDARDRAEVEAHLLENAEAAASVAAFAAQNEALRAALAPVLSEPLPPALLRDNWAPQTRRESHRRLAIAAAVAFAAGVFVGAGSAKLGDMGVPWVSAPNDVGATIARAAVDAHRVFIPEVLHPVEVRRDEQGHLLQWLSKRLGYAMTLPELQGDGFSLVGGRLLSGSQGPAALFMFETSSGSRLTLYCGRVASTPDSAFRFTESDGVGTIYWTADNIGFAVTGPFARGLLQQLAERFFASMEQEPKRPT
jgi:anti-sigma factor RsiW